MTITPEQKIEARYKLVQSARLAKASGHSQLEWIESELIQKYIIELDLDKNIADHIAAWVWTYRRR